MSRKKYTNPGHSAPEDTSRSTEKFLTEHLSSLKTNTLRCFEDVGAHTQLYPHRTLLWALGAGYMLRVLPTSRIVAGTTHLAVALLKPAALVYGVTMLWNVTRSHGVPQGTQETS